MPTTLTTPIRHRGVTDSRHSTKTDRRGLSAIVFGTRHHCYLQILVIPFSVVPLAIIDFPGPVFFVFLIVFISIVFLFDSSLYNDQIYNDLIIFVYRSHVSAHFQISLAVSGAQNLYHKYYYKKCHYNIRRFSVPLQLKW
ncbi:unnamed protein product [Haemonchus placei]|uniref:Uncharacterized protein n=1 Tax=Haemonchus placei TaxID=6290 RepID=A0A0N4WXU8_HAEPC|nr:unnamed protein product [Haemonchus placei]